MKNWMNKMQEYDKRLGMPEFEGWEEREREHHKQSQKEQLILPVVSNTEGKLVCDCGSTNVSFTKYLFFKCHDCKNEWDEAN